MRTFIDRRVLIGVVLGLLVVTAGCSGGTQPSGDAAQASGGGGDGGDTASLEFRKRDTPAASQEKESARSDSPQIRRRAIIRTGKIAIQVQDFDAAERNLTRAVNRYGGFVSDSRVEVDRVGNTSYRNGMLVLRVPRDNFSEMMAHARTIGDLQSSTTQSKDVTGKLVDINARLKNLRAERDRLRQLYRNATDTEEVLAVEKRLSDVQGEIERLEARKKSLRRKVALSTIRVELHEPRPESEPTDTSRWYDTPVVAAFLGSVDGVLVTLRAIVVAGAYAAPYLLVFGVPTVGLAYGIYRRRRNRRQADTGPVAAEATDGTDGAESEGEQESDDTQSDDGDQQEA